MNIDLFNVRLLKCIIYISVHPTMITNKVAHTTHKGNNNKKHFARGTTLFT